MTKLLLPSAAIQTLADLLEQLGGIDPGRVRVSPPPGRAREKDVIALHDHEDRLCELVDGVLVEKVMSTYEALLASWLLYHVWAFLDQHDLGIALGADGMLRLKPKLVRIPDISFISWDRLPSRELPDQPIARLVPDLAVEVLSKGNTKGEMERKLHEYFDAGVSLVWFVQPKTCTVDVYTTPTKVRRLRRDQTLEGGEVLPGFTLPLQKLFNPPGGRRTGR
jgi:Uma2 family endonuclease